MLISARAAAWRLELCGLTRRQAHRVLGVGLGGRPLRPASISWFEEDDVETLARWPTLDVGALDEVCRWGVFVARRDVQIDTAPADQRAALGPGWGFSDLTAAAIRHRIDQHGHLPLVATVCGFVVTGAEVTRVRWAGTSYTLDLREPGPWFAGVAGHRVPTGPGRPWVVRGLPGQPARPVVGHSSARTA